jgi:hypothetical protein
MGYVYQGTTHDIEPEPVAPTPTQRTASSPGRKPIYGSGCGTPAGYSAHHRRGEVACDPCKAASAAKRRKQNRANRKNTRTLVRVDAKCPNCGHHVIEGAAA